MEDNDEIPFEEQEVGEQTLRHEMPDDDEIRFEEEEGNDQIHREVPDDDEIPSDKQKGVIEFRHKYHKMMKFRLIEKKEMIAFRQSSCQIVIKFCLKTEKSFELIPPILKSPTVKSTSSRKAEKPFFRLDELQSLNIFRFYG